MERFLLRRNLVLFIHIGDDHVIRSREIVTISNFDMIEASTITDKMMEQIGMFDNIKGDKVNAKSIILTVDQIYYCSLSVTTLKKRSNIQSMLQKFKNYYADIEQPD